jgi:hypothetical protein
MSANWKNRMPMVVGATLLVIALIIVARSEPAQGQQDREKGTTVVGGQVARDGTAGSGSRYTVIETQGFNLLVTDNAANKLYYYATDKDVPVGSPMKLRASLDLSQVGREEIKITPHNLENIRKKEDK